MASIVKNVFDKNGKPRYKRCRFASFVFRDKSGNL